jgi:Ca-activated chloride channel family protein
MRPSLSPVLSLALAVLPVLPVLLPLTACTESQDGAEEPVAASSSKHAKSKSKSKKGKKEAKHKKKEAESSADEAANADTAEGGAVADDAAADDDGGGMYAYEPAAPAPGEPMPSMAYGYDEPADQPRRQSGDRFRALDEAPFKDPKTAPLSTFSIDVDTAGYSIVRRYLNDGRLPPEGAVRIEEMLNYFDYAYAGPTDAQPFAVHATVGAAPWEQRHRLVRIGIKGKEVAPAAVPAANLVFLIDVSGSMEGEDRLGLLVRGFRMLVDRLRDQDTVGIVVYAGASGVVLEPTSDKRAILSALDRLQAGGSTNGGEGIESAYALAQKHFKDDGINRVILATDGDFNVGTTSDGDLVALIRKKAESRVFLSVLGFGEGNYNDSGMEQLADEGNGQYAYVDSLDEARKVLVQQMAGTLVTIAKDVKIQIEFNPAKVESYRLIGYENRALADEEFNDDKKDAGEIGAGHTVTALYEVVPKGAGKGAGVDPLRYQKPAATTGAATGSDELLTVKIRYKKPDGDKSVLMTSHVADAPTPIAKADADFRFAAAVAGFGMKLRASKSAALDYATIIQLAKSGLGDDESGYRSEFLALVRKAETIAH